ncbi:MAG: flagellar filament outer layer protein FlaA [Treponema sp.]|nr:flagellar filament outer layer protein FlaA [Treponema sp.]
MKRFVIFAMCLVAAVGVAYAQEEEIGAPNPAMMGTVVGQQELVEVSVERFEFEGTWYSTISSDHGFTVSRLFRGGPAARQPIAAEEGMDIPDEHVLGVRVDFLRRGYHNFTIRPIRPIPIEGVTKTVSVWVAGRNANHVLNVLVRDMRGRTHEIRMGTLNFQGWRRLTAAIPPQSIDGVSGVVQRNHRNMALRSGIEIVGFRIHTDPLESYGSYYIYFDDLRAITDLFAAGRDPDDMVDGW